MRKQSTILSIISTLLMLMLMANANAANKVLYLGDSHSMSPSYNGLYQDLITKYGKDNVYFLAFCGFSAQTWLIGFKSACGSIIHMPAKDPAKLKLLVSPARTASISKILNAVKPTVTILAIGTNGHKGTFSDQNAAGVKLINQVRAAGSNCLWIGMPKIKNPKDKLDSDVFYKNAINFMPQGECPLIRSDEIYPKLMTHGFHYDPKSATEWVNAIINDETYKQVVTP